jgi:hypothetical protein
MSDNRALSAKPRSPRSDEEVVEAVVRLVRAVGRRAAESDPDAAAWLELIREELASAFARAVESWRALGFTDGQIARELGVSKQAVAQRWPRERA